MIIRKIKRFISEPYLLPYRLDEWRIITLPDDKYLKYRYRIQLGKKLDLDNPKTFNEKMQWLKLHDRNPKYIKMVDKYEAKKYVSEIIGDEYIIPTIGIYDSFDEIDFNNLPNKFVMKCTHDSGCIIICKDKKKLDIEQAKQKFNKGLKRNYYFGGREWPYKELKPRIIIEEYMNDGINEQLNDYKLMCFNGKVESCFVCSERNNKKDGLAVTFFDKKWNKMPFKRHYRNSNKEIKKPINYNKMIELAEILSNGIPFLRVDFYEIKGKIYFGELTFYPGSGFEEFSPEEWDYKLGEMIDISMVDNNEK